MTRSLILAGLVVGILAAVAVVAIADSGGDPVVAASTQTHASAPPDPSVAAAARGARPRLVDGAGRTLYLWSADRGRRGTCTGACARAWPPVTTTASVRAGTGI